MKWCRLLCFTTTQNIIVVVGIPRPTKLALVGAIKLRKKYDYIIGSGALVPPSLTLVCIPKLELGNERNYWMQRTS